jgi:hypothetical protein
MKTMRYLTLASLGLIAALTLPALGSSATGVGDLPEKEVIECLRAIEAAAERLDVNGVFEHVMDNSQGALVQNGRVFLTREKALETTREGFVGVRKVRYAIGQEHVTMMANDLALVVSDGQSHFEMEDGRLFDTPFAQSVILKRVAGVWKVLHAHRSFPVKR